MSEYWRIQTDEELDNCFRHLKQLKDSLGPLKIEWGKFVKTRSNSQNKLFHQWCGDIAKHWTINSVKRFGVKSSYSKEDIKRIWKSSRYGARGKKYDPVLKRETPYLLSTSDYEVGQMFELMCAMQAFEAEAGHILEVVGEFEKNLEAS